MDTRRFEYAIAGPVYVLVPLPMIHEDDYRALMPFLPAVCCGSCHAAQRRLFSAVICCAVLGLPLREARNLRWKWSIQPWRERVTRAGLFDRLAEAGIFSPVVCWSIVASGRHVESSPFAPGAARQRHRAVSRQRLADCRPIIEQEDTERRRQLAAAACGAGDGIALRDLSVGELQDLSTAARRLSRSRKRQGDGGGADALGDLGQDRYVAHLNVLAEPITRRVARLAAELPRSADERLDELLVEHHRPGSRMMSVPPSWLPSSVPRWTIHGLPARVVEVDGGPHLQWAGDLLPVDEFDRVPADVGSISFGHALPRMSSPCPF